MRRPRFLSVAAVLAASVLLLTGCGDSTPDAPTAPAATAQPGATAPAAGCEYIEAGGAAREVQAPSGTAASGQIPAVLTTSAGDIAITLDGGSAPCTVASFLSLADQGYYDDTVCHRLTTAGIFVLQCGDPSGTGRGGPGYRYADELTGAETYPAGTVAMANAGADTNGSQFFLVYEDTALPAAYTIFGQMDTAGIDVVRAIAAAGTTTGGPDGAPATPVTIEQVSAG